MHGPACLIARILAAKPITRIEDFSQPFLDAIGYVAPYEPPPGVPPLPENGTYGENGVYVVDNVRLALRLQGRSPKPLCTFDAWINANAIVQHDDGRDEEHVYLISGVARVGPEIRHLAEIRVPAEEFTGGKWETKWGYDAFVYPGRSTREHLATAVRDRQRPTSYIEYTSPGWHTVGGKLRFLHCQGAVGDATIRVTIPGSFDRFVLPTVPEKARDGVRETLWALRNLAPMRVMASLIGCAFRAPLCHWRSAPVTLYIVGSTGIGKSTIAAVAASFFGDFPTEQHLLGWASSANALEDMLYIMKDHLIPMDDVVADGDKQQLQEKINRIVRAQGNSAGRRRMTATLDQRPVRTPRGLPLVTGEVAPTVSSLIARCILIELREGDLLLRGDTAKPIDRAQASGPLFRHAMAGYVEWLAELQARENMSHEIDTYIANLRVELRTAAEDKATSHSRIPGNLAQAACGLHYFLRYAVDLGQISRADADALLDEGLMALLDIANDTGDSAASHQTALGAMIRLHKLVNQGRVRFLKKGYAPGTDSGTGRDGSGLPMVGWSDAQCLYIPRAGLDEVFRAARDAGHPIAVTEDRIMRELLARKVLDKGEGYHLAKQVRTIRGEGPQRVYTLRRDALEAYMGEPFWLPGEGDPSPSGDDDEEPKSGHRSPF